MRMILIRNKPGTSYRKAQADCIYRGIKYADGSGRCVSVWVGYDINSLYTPI